VSALVSINAAWSVIGALSSAAKVRGRDVHSALHFGLGVRVWRGSVRKLLAAWVDAGEFVVLAGDAGWPGRLDMKGKHDEGIDPKARSPTDRTHTPTHNWFLFSNHCFETHSYLASHLPQRVLTPTTQRSIIRSPTQ
jgi:hypothetical protein